MKTAASPTIAFILRYLQRGDTLPLAQLRRLGLIYSSYRLVISIFLVMMSYFSAKSSDDLLLPSFLQQTALFFYFLLSLILFGLFLVVAKSPWRQLVFGLALDVIILSLLLYTNGAPDLQLTMLYMVVVAASFMLLHVSQALVITLLAIIFVIYQQFFYAIANSMSLTNLGDALLMSASFLAVGFLSWSVSQRLAYVEKMAARHEDEVARLNTINKEVISQMISGVMVIEKKQVVLANAAAYQLLGIDNEPATNDGSISNTKAPWYWNQPAPDHVRGPFLSQFQRQLQAQHAQLLEGCLSVAAGQSRSFVYELPALTSAAVTDHIRVQITPLKDCSQLILLEDLRREKANAQQLKLASLGQLTASIAHEIRNPLAAISQASQLLMEDVSDSLQSEADNLTAEMMANQELYKMIFAQTKRVNRIIEDVLKLSRQQKPNQQALNLSLWLPQFLDNYFHGHDVFLQTTSQPTILFDTNQLEQILINLINNGLRYSSRSHPHAYVEIKVYCQQNDVIIDVMDDGDGVSDADLGHLFNPFFTTDKAGTGLGLYLSQAFSEANHTRLMYVPEHEKTCFRLIAPLAGQPSTNKNSVANTPYGLPSSES